MVLGGEWRIRIENSELRPVVKEVSGVECGEWRVRKHRLGVSSYRREYTIYMIRVCCCDSFAAP